MTQLWAFIRRKIKILPFPIRRLSLQAPLVFPILRVAVWSGSNPIHNSSQTIPEYEKKPDMYQIMRKKGTIKNNK